MTWADPFLDFGLDLLGQEGLRWRALHDGLDVLIKGRKMLLEISKPQIEDDILKKKHDMTNHPKQVPNLYASRLDSSLTEPPASTHQVQDTSRPGSQPRKYRALPLTKVLHGNEPGLSPLLFLLSRLRFHVFQLSFHPSLRNWLRSGLGFGRLVEYGPCDFGLADRTKVGRLAHIFGHRRSGLHDAGSVHAMVKPEAMAQFV